MKPINSTIAMILAALLIPFGLITVLTDAPTPLKVAGILAAGAETLVGSRSANGFWKTLGAGAGGGAVAGLLVLGPGLRLAMRLVAIADPIREPEFTIEGTMFIVMFFGLIFGGIFGIAAGMLGTLVGNRWTTLLFTVLGLALLTTSEELRSELFELGYGWPVNVPLFGLVFCGWAVIAGRLITRFQASRTRADLVDLGAPV